MKQNYKLIWLITLIIAILAMIMVGGKTRLSRSGLSITQWKVVTGTLPPLNQQQWQKEFDHYKKSPEFLKINSHFTLKDYKNIYWWEYIHRLLGRFIFLLALIPGIILWRKKQISGRYALMLPLLIAFQGLIGWLMVRSGLNERPSVSHFMLSIHFFLALLSLVVCYYPIAKMKKPISDRIKAKDYFLLVFLGYLFSLQILYGCFASGLKAGLYYNTFPLMNGSFLPASAFSFESITKNMVSNPIMVQWIHRWLGIFTFTYLIIIHYYFTSKVSKQFQKAFLHLSSIVLIQIILGISTLILKVPTSLAMLHQIMAVLIMLGFCNIIFRIKKVA